MSWTSSAVFIFGQTVHLLLWDSFTAKLILLLLWFPTPVCSEHSHHTLFCSTTLTTRTHAAVFIPQSYVLCWWKNRSGIFTHTGRKLHTAGKFDCSFAVEALKYTDQMKQDKRFSVVWTLSFTWACLDLKHGAGIMLMWCLWSSLNMRFYLCFRT